MNYFSDDLRKEAQWRNWDCHCYTGQRALFAKALKLSPLDDNYGPVLLLMQEDFFVRCSLWKRKRDHSNAVFQWLATLWILWRLYGMSFKMCQVRFLGESLMHYFQRVDGILGTRILVYGSTLVHVFPGISRAWLFLRWLLDKGVQGPIKLLCWIALHLYGNVRYGHLSLTVCSGHPHIEQTWILLPRT